MMHQGWKMQAFNKTLEMELYEDQLSQQLERINYN